MCYKMGKSRAQKLLYPHSKQGMYSPYSPNLGFEIDNFTQTNDKVNGICNWVRGGLC